MPWIGLPPIRLQKYKKIRGISFNHHGFCFDLQLHAPCRKHQATVHIHHLIPDRYCVPFLPLHVLHSRNIRW